MPKKKIKLKAKKAEHNLAYYQHNPIAWAKEVLTDSILWDKQKEILESIRDHKITLVKSAHGLGKTFIAAIAALHFLYTHPPSKVITIAPSWAQVEKLLWAEINNLYKEAKCSKYGGAGLGGRCLTTELKINDNWFAIGLSPKIGVDDQGDRFTGFHSENILIIFDEAPAVSSKLWQMKETLLTSANVKFLGIGNPIADHGDFFEGFKGNSINTNKITMGIFDSPNFKDNGIRELKDLIAIANAPGREREIILSKHISNYKSLSTPAWAVERLLKWGASSPIFHSRVLAQFPKMATDTAIPLAALEEVKDIESRLRHIPVIGVDVARFGTDNTVIIGYKDGRQNYKKKFSGQDLVATANTVKHLASSYGQGVLIVIDDTGLGGGVTDMLRAWAEEEGTTLDPIIIAVNFGQASTREEYEGIVTDMYFRAKEFIEGKQIRVEDDGDLFSQLSSRKYKFTNKGKIRIESKDEYKRRMAAGSPDEGDAFILCTWGISLQIASGTGLELGDTRRSFADKMIADKGEEQGEDEVLDKELERKAYKKPWRSGREI